MGFPYKRSIYLTEFSKILGSIYIPNVATTGFSYKRSIYIPIFSNFLESIIIYTELYIYRMPTVADLGTLQDKADSGRKPMQRDLQSGRGMPFWETVFFLKLFI